VEIVVEGKKRKLIIKDTHLEDAGEITCKTNRDASSCNFQVKCKHHLFNYTCSVPRLDIFWK
jgi:hypothetical protein